MPILFIDVARAVWAMRRDPGFVALALLAVLAMVGGTVFYWQVEDLRPLDAGYLSVLTLATVGYGDFAPTTDAGKVFTSVFVLVGVGIMLALFTTIAGQVRRRSVLHRPLGRLAAHDRSDPQVHSVPALSAVGEYDVLVIGSDEAGRQTAVEAARAGLRVVVVEDRRVLAELDGSPT
jgi:voltage-gated potassium channel